MRLRRKTDTRQWLEQRDQLVVLEPEKHKGNWAGFFGNDHPIHVELGIGKGTFVNEHSLRSPELNFIGIDMYDELVRRSAELATEMRADIETPTHNLALVLHNIEQLDQCFSTGEIARIYLNFSDPWPKTRHAHRRLTHNTFMQTYLKVLQSHGEIHFKTDSRTLFEFSLNVFAGMDLKMRNISLDLHKTGNPPNNVMTEYESKFVGQGEPIYRCEVLRAKESG